jgi:ankyrin repeat protein
MLTVCRSFVDDPELTQWFLDRGADLNARCYLDITPLSLAVRDAEPSFVHTLLNRGDIRRGQLVHYAVERSQNTVEVLDMLISKGASFDEVQYHNDQESWDHEHFKGLGTPLFRAAELGKLHVVEYLLGKGSDKAKRNTKDQTPLDIAMKLEHTDVVTLLESFQPTL